jgi:hypothetical protein
VVLMSESLAFDGRRSKERRPKPMRTGRACSSHATPLEGSLQPGYCAVPATRSLALKHMEGGYSHSKQLSWLVDT